MILINTLETTLTLFLAYLVVATLSGCFAAWVAGRMGDHTAEYAGLLTLNPIAHIDPIGVILLVLFGFGWGRHVPVNPYFIESPHEKLKTAVAMYASTFMQLIIAVSSLFILLILFDVKIIEQVQPMLFTGDIYLPQIAQFYPNHSSLTLVVGALLVAIVYLAALLAVIDFLLNSFKLVLHLFTNVQMHDDFLLFIIPMLIIYFLFVGPLRVYFMIKIVQFAKLFYVIVLFLKHLLTKYLGL
jgi:hypothetical protein